jgi:hypothetical protein
LRISFVKGLILNLELELVFLAAAQGYISALIMFCKRIKFKLGVRAAIFSSRSGIEGGLGH